MELLTCGSYQTLHIHTPASFSTRCRWHFIYTQTYTLRKKNNYKLTSVSYSRKKYSTPKVENKTRSERGKKKMIRHHFLVIVSSCQQLEITEQWWIYNLDSRRTTEERFKSTSQSNWDSKREITGMANWCHQQAVTTHHCGCLPNIYATFIFSRVLAKSLPSHVSQQACEANKLGCVISVPKQN